MDDNSVLMNEFSIKTFDSIEIKNRDIFIQEQKNFQSDSYFMIIG